MLITRRMKVATVGHSSGKATASGPTDCLPGRRPRGRGPSPRRPQGGPQPTIGRGRCGQEVKPRQFSGLQLEAEAGIWWKRSGVARMSFSRVGAAAAIDVARARREPRSRRASLCRRARLRRAPPGPLRQTADREQGAEAAFQNAKLAREVAEVAAARSTSRDPKPELEMTLKNTHGSAKTAIGRPRHAAGADSQRPKAKERWYDRSRQGGPTATPG